MTRPARWRMPSLNLGVCVRLPGLACASTAKEAIALARE